MRNIIPRNILVFAITDSLGNFARSMVFPYGSLYILALGGDAATVGMIAFVGQLGGLFLLPVAGHISDHADRIRLVGLASFWFGLSLLLVVFAPSWEMVALASLLNGVIVIQFPAYAGLIADSLPPQTRGKGLGLLNTISNSIAIFAPFLAALVIERYTANLGMRMLYGVMLALSLAAAFIQLRFLKETSSAPRQALQAPALLAALSRAFREIPALVRAMPPALRALAGVVVLTFMTNGLVGSFWVIYATEKAGLSAAAWGVIMLVEAVARLVLFLPAGMLVDRLGRTRVLAAALAVTCLVTPLFVLLPGFASILLVRVALSVAFVMAFSSCTALMADLVPSPVRGQVMAAIGQGGIIPGMVGSPGGPAMGYLIIPPVMIASLAGGFIYTLNPGLPWLLAAGLGVCALLLVLVFIRDPQRAED